MKRFLAYLAVSALLAFHLTMLAFAAVGCAGPIRVAAFVESQGTQKHQPTLPAEVRSACHMLGIQCVAPAGNRHEIRLALIDGPLPGINGRALDSSGCTRIAWARLEAATVAHELGHLLGLGHSDDRSHLMHHSSSGTMVTDEQVRQMQSALRYLRICKMFRGQE